MDVYLYFWKGTTPGRLQLRIWVCSKMGDTGIPKLCSRLIGKMMINYTSNNPIQSGNSESLLANHLNEMSLLNTANTVSLRRKLEHHQAHDHRPLVDDVVYALIQDLQKVLRPDIKNRWNFEMELTRKTFGFTWFNHEICWNSGI